VPTAAPDVRALGAHRHVPDGELANNQQLIARAGANGHERLAENLRRVQANLEKIIPALESLADETNLDDSAS
jgi:hypothetical protein